MTALPEDALDREVLDQMPVEIREAGVVVPLDYLLKLHKMAFGGGPMVVDSAWLALKLGRSQEWWATEAREGKVRAWQDGPGAPWYFDRRACERHLAALLNERRRSTGGVGSRGPRSQQRDAA